jgi:putative tryptophan/tyrosine transport system substrate-binding protein
MLTILVHWCGHGLEMLPIPRQDGSCDLVPVIGGASSGSAVDRRTFVGTLGIALLTAPLAAEAQGTQKAWRIGWLSIAPHPFLSAFRRGLHDLGYAEGGNVTIKERYAEGQPDHLPELARELLAQRVDILVTSGKEAGLAAMKVTTSVPIVAITANLASDGLVRSLSHPGGNVTGLDLLSVDLSVKWLELLRTTIPKASRIAVLVDTSSRSQTFETMNAAASSLDVQLVRLGAHDPASINAAFTEAVRQRVGGLIPISSPVFATYKRHIVALAAKHRMPTMYEHRDFVDAGGLMSYGPNLDAVFQRAAVYVDKIFQGAKPADLPVEQPTKFELVINLRTARTLNLEIPQSLLLRADQVIE